MDALNEEWQVQFLDDGSTEPSPAQAITEELAAVLACAATWQETLPQLNFNSLLSGLVALSEDSARPVTSWIRRFAKDASSRWLSLGHLESDPSQVRRVLRRPLTRSGSARRALDEALEIKKRSRSTGLLDVVHLLAAILWLPDYHGAELAELGIDRHQWRRALAEMAAQLRPDEVGFWLSLREDEPASGPARPPETEAAAAGDRSAEVGAPGRVPLLELELFDLSPMTKRLFNIALELVRDDADSDVVSTSTLVAAIVDPRFSKAESSVEWFTVGLGEALTRLRAHLTRKYHRDSRRYEHASPLEFTHDVGEILKRAAELAQAATNGKKKVHSRHLIGTLLSYAPARPTDAQQLFVELGCDSLALRRSFLQSVLSWGEDDSAVWQRALGSPPTEAANAADAKTDGLSRVRPSFDLARITNDRVTGPISPDRDFLDASRPALRFAKLLTARDVQPPIALGLFGNWGTGKSFFMGLMQNHVTALTEGSDPAYVRRAAQIEFNAWHYQDTNLWATMALRIFDGLAQKLAPSVSQVQEKRKELNQAMSSSTQRKAEADAQRKSAIERREEKSKELAQKLAKRELSVAERFANAWSVVQKEAWFPGAAAGLERVASELGLSAALRGWDDLGRLDTELTALGDKTQVVVAAVAERFQPKKLWVTLPALLLLVAGTAWFGGFTEWLISTLHLQQPLPGAATLAQVAAVVTTITGWVSGKARLAQQGLAKVARLDAQVQLKARELEADPEAGASAQRATELRAQIAQLDQEIQSTSEQVSEAERQIAAATAEIERINQGGLVYDFLQEKKTSSKYVGQLGLVSTLREDLGELGSRLSDPKLSADRRIDRIILYVDDLDRCQPAKVVEVLQAVHLLLAFPYFHVVVGVDARWLRRSLEDAYSGGPERSTLEGFSAHDYLEKIFQIPYALAPLNELGFQSLVDGMLKTRSEWTEDHQEQRKQAEAAQIALRLEQREKEEGEAFTQAVKDILTPGQAEDSPAPGNAASGSGGAKTGSGSSSAKEGATDRSDAGSPPYSQAPLSTSAAPVVFFEDHEGTFIKALSAFIDRPRLAGRFVNVYRLLRARAADDGEDGSFAAEPGSVDYRAALLLLAINVGHPHVAGHFFQALGEAKEKTWSDFIKMQASCVVPDDLREPYARLFSQLSKLKVELPSDLARYQHWASRVVCYSFDLPSLLASGPRKPAQTAHGVAPALHREEARELLRPNAHT